MNKFITGGLLAVFILGVSGYEVYKAQKSQPQEQAKSNVTTTDYNADSTRTPGNNNNFETYNNNVLHVYKTPTCSCCRAWVSHLENENMLTQTTNLSSLSNLKDDYGIANQYQSCHTAVSKNGFVFEGHVPAKFIKEFLQAPPENAIGLSVPGMSVGSPGMESGNQFMPYSILVLMKNGEARNYAEVKSYADQF